jgi:DNA-binding Lrp family transcriptional regulator
MVKIDLKDRKILYHLDLDSRQSSLEIGKKVGLSKNVVNYRVKRLEKEGLINNYYTAINFHRLGYTNLAFYLNYQYYTPSIEKEIIDYFIKNKYSWWIANVQGKYDLMALFLVKDLNDFFIFWKETLKRYRYYFQESTIAFFPYTYHYHNSYLIDDYKINDHEKFGYGYETEKAKIDNVDLQILNLIALNARLPLTEIAKTFNSSSTMINNRIKKLKKFGIILGFRIHINYSKLGYQLFNVHLSLKNYEKMKHIIVYVKTNPHLIYINEVVDHCDLDLNYYLKSFNEMHSIIKDIYKKFPNDIKNHMTLTFPKIFKSNYLPGELTK